ncbi:MAG: glycosyltransferase family 2 protein [Acutalibacteraceae bacterium]|nr:glycosyltransferase family 2 protein [Acutalibacteraceae bacterium]
MKKISVSVIIPVYNAEKTLKRCLDSLLKQTVKDIEVIVVDDGSTDGSPQICDEYAERYGITVIHKPNGGVSTARNRGIEEAKGKYFMFCDSDDWVEENYVEVFYSRMEESDAELTVGGLVFNNTTQKQSTVKNSGTTESYCINKKDFYELRDKDLLAYPVNKLYLTSFAKEKNIKFKVGLSECEDLVFNLQYIGFCEKGVLIIPEALYHYEFHEGSLSTRYHNDRFFDVIRPIFNTYEETIEKTGVDNEDFLKDFYTTYFLKTIENIPILWDKRNTFGLFRKIIKVQKILLSEEYAVCYRKMDKSRFNKLSLLVYGSRFLPLVLFLLRK